MGIAKVIQMGGKKPNPLLGIRFLVGPKESRSLIKSDLAIKLILNSADRISQIAKSAYYKSEARGFEPNHDVEDWLAAEAEVSQ